MTKKIILFIHHQVLNGVDLAMTLQAKIILARLTTVIRAAGITIIVNMIF